MNLTQWLNEARIQEIKDFAVGRKKFIKIRLSEFETLMQEREKHRNGTKRENQRSR